VLAVSSCGFNSILRDIRRSRRRLHILLLLRNNNRGLRDRLSSNRLRRRLGDGVLLVGGRIVGVGIAWVLLVGSSLPEVVVLLGRPVEGIEDLLGSSLG